MVHALHASPASAQNAGFPVDPPSHPPSASAPPPATPPPAVAPPASIPSAAPAASPALAPSPAAPAVVPAQPATTVAPSLPQPPQLTLSPPAGLAPSVAWSPPAILPYRDGIPIPPGYHVEKRAATGLIGTGLGMLAVGYVVGLGLAIDHDFEGGLGWMAVPVIGAWPAVAGSEVKCTAQDVPAAKQCLSEAYDQATTIAIVAVDGMVQATGVALLVAGLLSGRSELVRDDLQVSARQRPEGGFDLGVRGSF
ncbi:MAG: hypothetical protein ACOY0T_35830 [Myxococcota bacterium]